nr:biotin/lipoyl-containing protein [Henriciella sp.]
MAAPSCAGNRSHMIYIAPDELTPAAECAIVHRLLEDGDDPNDWSVSYVWASDDVYAVVLTCGVAVRALVCTPLTAKMLERLPEKPKPDTSKLIISPMPGLVVSVDVEVGQQVEEGEAVCIVEAMKMQNIIRAEATGTVKTINVGAGDSVAADEIMVEFE